MECWVAVGVAATATPCLILAPQEVFWWQSSGSSLYLLDFGRSWGVAAVAAAAVAGVKIRRQ